MNDGDWFAPKRFGYGAGLPIAWQGWAVLGLHLAVCLAALLLLMPRHVGLFMAIVAIVAIATVPLVIVAAQHTRGGWKWRWGND